MCKCNDVLTGVNSTIPLVRITWVRLSFLSGVKFLYVRHVIHVARFEAADVRTLSTMFHLQDYNDAGSKSCVITATKNRYLHSREKGDS